MTLDTIDAKILNVLQENARVSISELSKRVHLSLSAVSERLKKLESSGIIDQYTTILNSASLDKQISSIMLVSLEDPSKIDEFLKFIDENDEILEAYHITGDSDYSLKIITSSMQGLESIINKIKTVSAVRKTQTSVVLSTLKHKYSIPPIPTKE